MVTFDFWDDLEGAIQSASEDALRASPLELCMAHWLWKNGEEWVGQQFMWIIELTKKSTQRGNFWQNRVETHIEI